MTPILTPDGVRQLDARLERARLLDLAMEDAGRAVAAEVQRHWPQGQVLLLAGGGANGGDAFVAARHLLTQGRAARVLARPSTHPLTRLNRRRWQAVGGDTRPLSAAALSRAARDTVLVDGLLGTGFRPPVRDTLAAVLEAVSAARARGVPVLAIDLPSGLDATRADPPGPSVQADVTVTFAALKPALLFWEAAARCGQVVLAPLTVPPDWLSDLEVAAQPDDADLAPLLPVRSAGAHKGVAGRVWIVGGHAGTVGAPALAGLGALRAGAGLVTLHAAVDLPLVTPELMIHRHADLPAFLAGTAPDRRPDALALGMGLGPDAASLAREVLRWQVPTVLDADALQPELSGHGHAACLWTPHPGEAARLLGLPTPDITRDPIGAARALQERLGGVVILKGGPSVVARAGELSVSRGGHPGMASAGMGDTLSGVLAALLGQGLSTWDAARVGVRLHARAGERAAEQFAYGLGATDVAGELGRAWMDLRGGSAHLPGV
ncbi:NAD(P)H-hydrate dehydratase [Deinococcus radiotolerans]|uniref:Bifunctional NAD(P)H-hydrate repair enzyme n=1 Tax=Deinococcus radiotolerans TaxID=1309407 RepID=A0ABQ2FGU2_9DEIO|nr:NAD(P)H-hydrate dehydratase [Deinococcus radiotolerans]GGK89343.1 bifunctional NAD(P)H-hydrate repair enzyme [Deinococcus radiotolerans]